MTAPLPTVLLVEDDAVDAEAVGRMLEGEFQIETRELADDALSSCREQRPDCVLLDYRLPDRDGLEVLEELVRLQIPTVMLTGQGDETTAVSAIKAGAFDYLTKSGLEPSRLAQTLHGALKRAELEHRLQAQQEKALRAQRLEAVGRLAGGLAHDFNNILLAAHAYCRFALDALAPGDPARRDVEEARVVLERGASLTAKLVALAANRSQPAAGCDPAQVVAGLSDLLARVVGRNVAVQLDLAPGPQNVPVDAGSLEQLVVNLAINARDAMPGGGGLEVVLRDSKPERSPESGISGQSEPQVLLVVADTGTGMDADAKRRAFDPFFTTKGESGTGLGLFVVHGIVNQAGGEIDLSSEPGKGTRFEIRLPRLQDTVPGAASEAAAVSRAASPARLLVVEDDAQVREVTVRELRGLGYDVLGVANAQEALRAFEEGEPRFDAVITDAVMPGMGGVELADRLQNLEQDLPVLIVSGFNPTPVGRAANRWTLAKPWTQHSLGAKLRQLLDTTGRAGRDDP